MKGDGPRSGVRKWYGSNELSVFQDLAEEVPRALVLRRLEELRRRPALFDRAPVHGDHAVGDLAGEAHLVVDRHHGHALARQFDHDAEHPYTAVCESAFSAGVRETVLRGIVLAWIPMSLARRDVESGRLLNLSDPYGSIALDIALDISLYGRGDGFFSRAVLGHLRAIKRGGGGKGEG